MKKSMKIGVALAGLALATGVMAGCASDADKTSENLSTAAEAFEIQLGEDE